MRGILVALIAIVGLPAYADSCVWYADDDSIRQVRTSDNQITRTVALRQPHRLVMNAQDCGVWTLDKYDRKLLRFDADGQLERVIRIRDLNAGLDEVERLQVDAYDGSLWLTDDRRIAHVSAEGALLHSFNAPGDVQRMEIGLDQTLWVLGRRELWHFDAQGTQLARFYLGQHLAGDARFFALDSVEGVLWVVDDDDLAQLRLSAPAEPVLRIRLRHGVRGFSLDPLSGKVWVAQDDALRAFLRSGELAHRVDLSPLNIRKPEKLAFDPVSRSLWAGAERSVSRFTDSGEFVLRFSARDGDEALGAPAFLVRPALTLLQPPNNAVTNNPRPEFRLAYAVECNGTSCDLPASHLGTYILTATLNAQPVGAAFTFDPQTREAHFTPPERLPEGQNRFEAQLKDRFGHDSASIVNVFTVDTIAPRFLTIAPPNGSALQGPIVQLQGTIDDAAATVVLETTPSASQPGPAFSFPVTLQPGANVFPLSAIDKAGNRTTIQHTLFFVPLSLAISAPVSGATLAGSTVQVSGTITGPQNTGIAVNGIIATIVGSQFFATVPLQAGPNTITVVATTQDGFVMQQSVSVTGSGPAPIEVIASVRSGVAPLAVGFTLKAAAGTSIARVDVDFDGDGSIDSSFFGPTAPIPFTYQAGVYSARFVVTDNLARTTTLVAQIVVESTAAIDQQLRVLWGGFATALANGNRAAAMQYFNAAAKDKFGPVVDALLPNMPQIVASFAAPITTSISEQVGEYAIVRPNGTRSSVYLIYFVKGSDGVWRIDEM